MSEQAFIDKLVPGYKGLAQNWECDMNNHLNVSHFFGRSSDHAFYMRHALAMSPRQMVADARGTVALEEGMIVSNEPGYYEAGQFGIRIENLQYVTPVSRTPNSRDMLGFEPLTLAPIDRRLIDKKMMTRAEIDWLDTYHRRVEKTLIDKVDKPTQGWLKRNCKPL